MIEIVNNLEFKGSKKVMAVVGNMLIKVDEENELLFAYDIIESAFINYESEGILTEVNAEIALKIKKELNIDIADYGVSICDDAYEFSYKELQSKTY